MRKLSAGRNRVRDAQHWALTLSNGAEAMQAIARRKSSWSWYGPKECECRGSKSTTDCRIVHTQEVKFDELAAQNKVVRGWMERRSDFQVLWNHRIWSDCGNPSRRLSCRCALKFRSHLGPIHSISPSESMAGTTGLEPATSAVTVNRKTVTS